MWIKNTLLFIWAYIPFFALTDDLGFLTANKGSKEHEYYLSVISILFGENKIQFFSFPIKQKSKKVVWFRIKRLSDMKAFNMTDEKARQLEEGYKNHYDTLTEASDIDIEKESLLRHLSDEKARVDISYNKMNAFTSIILAVIPIAITLINWDTIFSLNVLGMLILVCLIYATVNLCDCKFMCMDFSGN